MVHISALFANKRMLILTSIIAGFLIIAALTIGLAVGLTRKKGSIENAILSNGGNGTCRSSLEGYRVNGTSVLGRYMRAAIAVDNADCSRIGRQILERNGTAVDAVIAAAICNGIMNAHSMGIGGGCIMTIYSQYEKKAYSLVGREQAPSAANATMFKGRETMSIIGGLSIAVPGELRAYRTAYERFGGGVPWKDLFAPTIKLCRDGFIISKIQATAIEEKKNYILQNPGMREVFLKNNQTDELYGAGDTIKREKLARTLEIIAEEGADAFYNGFLADHIVQEIREQGGIITQTDLANYQVDIREALNIRLNGTLTAFISYPPSSGIVLAYILNILQGYNFESNTLNNIDTAILFYHRLIEAFKFAYAERSELGDPLKINITRLINNLTSMEYADRTRARINDSQTYGFQYYGGTWLDQVKTGTTHISAVDERGDAVAMTSSINLYFGSTVLGTRTGILYNNHMDDFSIPNTTNFFGVPPSPVNFIAPGKRPSSSMAPTVIVDDNTRRVIQVIGASGGTKITTSTAQVSMLNLLFGKNIKEAIDMPRLHSQLLPQEVLAEVGFDQAVLQGLRNRGHNIQCGIYGGSIVQSIERRKENNQLWACSDIRKNGAPDGI